MENVFKCPFCGRTYTSSADFNSCVNKCSSSYVQKQSQAQKEKEAETQRITLMTQARTKMVQIYNDLLKQIKTYNNLTVNEPRYVVDLKRTDSPTGAIDQILEQAENKAKKENTNFATSTDKVNKSLKDLISGLGVDLDKPKRMFDPMKERREKSDFYQSLTPEEKAEYDALNPLAKAWFELFI